MSRNDIAASLRFCLQLSRCRNVVCKLPCVLRPALLLFKIRNQAEKFDQKHVVAIMQTAALYLTLFALLIMPARAENPAAAAKTHRIYDVTREGSNIGTETVDVERQGDTTAVKIKTDISVKIMFVEAYRYEHSCNEVWKSGQLAAFKSHTNDNGTKHSVEVTAASDKLSMAADGKHSDLPKTAAPVNFWGKEVIRHLDVFEPDTGRRLMLELTDVGPESVTINGATHQAHHYKIADTLHGEYVRDLWFDGDVLVRSKLLGSDKSVVLLDLR
jgi:Family of unknown function (DUF6134)